MAESNLRTTQQSFRPDNILYRCKIRRQNQFGVVFTDLLWRFTLYELHLRVVRFSEKYEKATTAYEVFINRNADCNET